jgi:hypothetical protein
MLNPKHKWIKTTLVCGKTWEMRVVQIQSTEDSRKNGAKPEDDGKWQATYYQAGDPKLWSNTWDTEEQAIAELDALLNLIF